MLITVTFVTEVRLLFYLCTEMAFKIPLPIACKKPQPVPKLQPSEYATLQLPEFRKSDFKDLTLIGQGSFGKVFRATQNGAVFVVKELTHAAASATERRLFVKEAEMLKALQGHENIVNVRGFSVMDCAILMEFVTFSFTKIGFEHEDVSSLKTFVGVCDDSSDFKGFEHLLHHIALDVCAGMEFLHSKNVVHRDLKPDNILVSNKHYINCDESDLAAWWTTRPVVAVLTDFGEARSSFLQTKTVSNTVTQRLVRGSPAYMAPEALVDDGRTADIEQLKAMDVWSLGMVLFSLTNPDAQFPYAMELEGVGLDGNKVEALKNCHSFKQLPKTLPKYELQQAGIWKNLHTAFVNCAEFDPKRRPKIKTVSLKLVNDNVIVQALAVSQSSVSEMLNVEAVMGYVSNVPSVDSADNACTFLAMLVADRVMRSFNSASSPKLEEIATDVILQFPSLSIARSTERHYSVDEAYKILRAGALCKPYNFNMPIYATVGKMASVAKQDLQMALHSVLAEDAARAICALYVCPPYTFLVCRERESSPLVVVDTHALSSQYGGRNTAALVRAVQDDTSICSICSWLFKRMNLNGHDNAVTHELAVLTYDVQTTYTTSNQNGVVDADACMNVMNNVSATSNASSGEKTPISKSTQSRHCTTPDNRKPHETVSLGSIESSSTDSSTIASVLSKAKHISDSLCLYDDSDDQTCARKESMNCNSEVVTFSVQSNNKSVSSTDDVNKKINIRWSKTEFSPELWDCCVGEEVSEIPSNIDGWRKLIISCDETEMMKVTKDGRPWQVWKTSSRRGFNGVRRVTRCKGSLCCMSKDCVYVKEHGTANSYHFKTVSGITTCFSCGSIPNLLECPAFKIWEYDRTTKAVTVFHGGYHTCAVKRKMKQATRNAIVTAIRRNPHVKPRRLINNEMVNIMSAEEFMWSDVEAIAEQYVDVKQVQNIRDRMKSEVNPLGENFDALSVYKQKCDEKDEFFIYRINSRRLNGEPSFVFKSSQQMARLALSMDRNSDGVLCKEFAHVDATHTRVRNFKTLTLWTYHPVMRKLMQLAIMDIEVENSENLCKFWQLFNSMLAKVSGNESYTFDPCGFVADEHHANWRSIQMVYGGDAVKRTVSCEFHYKQSVHRHARMLGFKVESTKFVQLAEAMLTALTVNEFDIASAEMLSFVSEHSELADWYKWWQNRRAHIFRAFKATEAPASNLAEVGHAKLASVGRKYMSLLEAAREDVASALRQEMEIKLFNEGMKTGGKGIDYKKRCALQYRTEMKRAAAYGAELGTNGITESTCKFVANKGIHRPPEKRRKIMKTKAANFLIKRKRRQDKPEYGDKQGESRTSVVEGNGCVNENPAANGKKAPAKSKPFHVVLFGQVRNVKKCYGCNCAFKEAQKKSPNDVILKYFCRREYTNKEGTRVLTPSPQACYFHLNLDCARKVEPTAECSDIIVHDEMRKCLTSRHKQHLLAFGLQL